MKELTGLESHSSLQALQNLKQSGSKAGDTASSILGLKDHHKLWDILDNIQVPPPLPPPPPPIPPPAPGKWASMGVQSSYVYKQITVDLILSSLVTSK
jgi:hypothetical protein